MYRYNLSIKLNTIFINEIVLAYNHIANNMIKNWILIHLLFTIAQGAPAETDYYKTLGVSKGATAPELKKAYRRQALKWHPDKNPDDREAAQDQFLHLQDAYKILEDPEKRKLYDQCGVSLCAGGQGGGDRRTRDRSPQGPDAQWSFSIGDWGFGADSASSGGGNPSFNLQDILRYFSKASNLRGGNEQIKMFPVGSSRVKRLKPSAIPGVGKHRDNKHTWVVLACSQNQPQCREQAGKFEALAQRVHGAFGVRVGFLDCDQCGADGRSACNTLNLRDNSAQPRVVRIFKGALRATRGWFEHLDLSKTGGSLARTSVARLASFAYESLQPSTLTTVSTAVGLKDFMRRCNEKCRHQGKGRAICVLAFSENMQGGAGVKGIAAHFDGPGADRCVHVANVRGSSRTHPVALRLGVTQHPAVVVVHPKTGDVTSRFQGKVGVQSVVRFIKAE